MGKNFLPEFLAVGAAQGVGAGLLHQRNLEEAYDFAKQNSLNNLDAQEKLHTSEEADDARLAYAKEQAKVAAYKPMQDNLSKFMQESNGGTTSVTPYSQPTPVQGVPQGLSPQGGGLQPRTAPVAAPQGANLPAGIGQTADASGQAVPQQDFSQAGGMSTPSPSMAGQGGPPAPKTPMTPPAQEQISPESPANQVATAGKALEAQKTGDPMDALAAIAQKNGVGPSFDFVRNDLKARGLEPTKELMYAGIQQHIASMQQKGSLEQYNQWAQGLIKDRPASMLNTSALQHQVVDSLTKSGITPQLTPLSAGEKADRDKLMSTFNSVDSNTDMALNKIAEITKVVGNTNTGYTAGPRATISTMWNKALGGQPSDEATNTGIFEKAQSNLTNEIMKGLKAAGVNLRMGAQIYTMEGKNVPSLNNSDAANLEILRSIGAGMVYNKDIADAARTITSIPGIRTNDIESELMHYTENNPPFKPDGVTPNPDRMPYQQWVAAGSPEGKVKGSDMRKAVQGEIETKRSAAAQGNNPAKTESAPKTVHFNDLPE